MSDLAVVVPCFNEEEVFPETARQLLELLDRLQLAGKAGPGSRLYFVDDGSRDQTWLLIEAAAIADPRVHGIKLARNSGHQNALLAGLFTAHADVIVSIDADLQDDPNVMEAMLDHHAKGCDIVYGVRQSRATDSAFKRSTARGYYRLLELLGVEIVYDHADYRLLSKRAICELRQYTEVNMFLRAVIPLLGFRSAVVYYERAARFAGETKYPLRRMVALAVTGVTSFSIAPLRFITFFGILTWLFSFAMVGWVLYGKLVLDSVIPGWASSVIPVYFLGGAQLLSIGVVGEYVAKAYLETKRRPRFVIEKEDLSMVDDRTAASRWLPQLLLLVSLAAGIWSVFATTMNHDVSYLLFVAGRVAKGATLYVDFPEVNPPLIIWLNMPCAWLAQHLGVADATVFRLMIATLGLVSVAWSGAILCRTLDKNDVWAWLAIGIYTVVVLPGYEFGQREHIAYLSVLPYLAEAACRLSGKRGSMVEHVAVALLAVIGVAIKPHFLLVPLLVEGAIISMTRRMPGTGVVVAMTLLVCYAASVHWLAPEYFNMLQLLAGSYWRNSEPWLGFVALPQFYCVAILLAITWFVRTKSRPVACVISFAVLGFALAAILQHKGWSYHWIPAMALGWILFGLAVSKAVAHRGAAVPLIITVLVAALASWNLLGAFRKGEKINPYPALLAPVIREMGGGPVIVFSNFEASFPLVTLPGIGTSSRFPTMTILGAVALDDNLKARKWIERSFVTDFRKQPPRLLLVETDERGIPVFDFVAYFAPLVPEISAYHKVRQVDKFQVLEAPDAHQRKFGIGL